MRGPLFLRDPPSASSSVASYVDSLCVGELVMYTVAVIQSML